MFLLIFFFFPPHHICCHTNTHTVPKTTTTTQNTSPERDPDYKFTKNLPKKCDGFTLHEIEFSCQVSSYKAPLKWYKDDEELDETEQVKYVITKDIIGNATLVIKRAAKSDAGVYKCRIDNTKLFTKCTLTISGIYF